MEFKNTFNSYGYVAQLFHWIIAILIITMLLMGTIMVYMQASPLRDQVFNVHQSLGLTILLLVLARLSWRLFDPNPKLSDYLQSWERISARVVHNIIYIVIIGIILSGITMTTAAGYAPSFFNLFTVPAFIAKNQAVADIALGIHKILAWTILVLISLHILAALKHHFFNKDDVLKRIFLNLL